MAAPLNPDENPYEVLGLGLGGASLSELEIKKAYRRRAIVLHPDKRPAAERAAAEVVRVVVTAFAGQASAATGCG